MQARTARRQRDIAFRERDRADRIAELMTGIFKVSDPSERVGNSVTAREVLDKASTDIETGLSKDPELLAHMTYVMGMAYLNLGLYSRAEALLDRSIRAANSAGEGENRETLKSMQKLAWTLVLEGRFAEAESQQRKLLDIEQRFLGPDDHDTVGVKGDFATTLSEEGHLAEAEKLQREVLESQKRALGPEASFTISSMNNLAAILINERRFPEADKLEREAIEIKLRVAGPENLSTIHYMQTEATIKMDMGELDESEKSLRRLLDLERRILRPNQPEIALTVYQLAMVAAKRGRTDEALALLRQAIDIGLRPADALQMGEDPDLNTLHGDPRFATLVAMAKERAAAQKAN
jgi:non-specific serine/threonine protein kinase/serine/threonine-protein kinase